MSRSTPESKISRRKGELLFDHIKEWSVEDHQTGCWTWQRAFSQHGYGVLRVGKRTTRAHRASYQLYHGVELDSSVDVCHTCDNRACVNPDHLFAGTRADNMRDCQEKGRIRLPNLMGSGLTQSKLTEDAVLAIRASQDSQRVLARRFGVNRRTIAFVQQRKTWRHV